MEILDIAPLACCVYVSIVRKESNHLGPQRTQTMMSQYSPFFSD